MKYISWVLLVEAVVTVTVNIVAILIFRRTPRLRCRKYLFIVNLCVADLFVGLVSVPLYVFVINSENLSKTVIDFYIAQDPFFGVASLFGLSAIAIERGYATYYPFKHRVLSILKYKISISLIWVGALATSVVIFTSGRSPSVSQTVMITITIAIPIAIVLVSYFLIWKKISLKKSTPNSAINRASTSFTVTLAIVTLFSFITWMPFMVATIIFLNCNSLNICKDDSYYEVEEVVLEISKVLHYGNSMINFFVYTVRMREFKAEIVRRLRCC